MRFSRTSMQRPLRQRLMPLAWALAALVALLLALSWGALKAQVALAGFLNGESIWSKAQKQAVIDLDTYALSGNPQYYEKFQRQYALLHDFRAVRDALSRGSYNRQWVVSVMRKHGLMEQAIPAVIFSVHHLRNAPYISDALKLWSSTDTSIELLQKVAGQLHDAYAHHEVDTAMARRDDAAIAALNAFIEPRSDRFSTVMAQGLAWISRVFFACLLGTALLAVLLWLWLAHRILGDVHGTEERFRLLFDSAADAIFMVEDSSGKILQANRRASAWTGYSEDQLRGRVYFELFESAPRSSRSGFPRISKLKQGDGSALPVEVSSSVVSWGRDMKVRQEILHDLSERIDMARERRIAAEAMAGVAEGVIITDAQHRVITVNAAHQRMTGFSLSDLEGLPFDDHRRMPDGQPLPDSVWDDIDSEGHWSGEVQTHRRDGSVYPEILSITAIRGANDRIEHYVAVCTDITDSKAGHRHLQYLATHDALTGLVNRPEFERRVDEAIGDSKLRHESAAVVFVDLDNFKLVNDSYSHALGDKLLMVVAERIHRHLPSDAVAGRIGGDEFTILVGRLSAREDVSWFARKLLEALSQPFMIDDYEIVLGASIGIASFPLDGYDAAALLTNADAAMYNAKQEERNSFRFYTPRMRADANRRLLLLTDLRRALEEDQFQLLYQPSVRFDSNRVVGAEALLRWRHPERGHIMPGEFVPIAETMGLIRHIDEWVLDRVCKQIARWNREGVDVVRIAVNISANSFSHPEFVSKLKQVIERNGIEPRQIMLEITEGTILRLGDAMRKTMSALHGLGVVVAIDDFGTGYSSLAYLKLPAVACLKIDRSFVDELPDSAEDASIVQAMMVMARSLGLAVIAEGVETESQHDFLRRAGCEEGQGFLYSEPVETGELERLLRSDQPGSPAMLKVVPPAK